MFSFARLNRRQGFRERADLIHFNQDGIRNSFGNSFAEKLYIGHEEIVADELDFIAESVGQSFPSRPIVFRTAVFDRDDWETRAELR